MKIIHVSDLHLDSKMEGLPSEKSKKRKEEVLRTFERLADYASVNGVTAVIIAGDAFDSARVSIKTKERVAFAITKNSGVDFIYLSGNHDDVNFISDMEVLPQNLKVIKDDWTYLNYGNVCVCGIMLSSLNLNMAYDTLNLDAEKFNIVVMHGQVAGYKSSDKNAEIISIPRLKERNIDYLALGHIHSYSEGTIDNRGKYCYSGCLEGRGFDEIGDKGFVLIDINNGEYTSEFIKFSSRNLYEYKFDVSGLSSWYNASEDLIKDIVEKFAVSSLIKVVLKGEHNADFLIDIENLQSRLNEIFFFAKVYDQTQLKINLDDYAHDKSVRGEFVRAVWESNLDMEKKSKVIACGLSALKGENI